MNKKVAFNSILFSVAFFSGLLSGAHAAVDEAGAGVKESEEINITASATTANEKDSSLFESIAPKEPTLSSSTTEVVDLNRLNFKNKEVLSIKQEDRIYISFMDEKRKKEEEKRKAEEDRKKGETKNALPERRSQGGVEVFPHDPDNPQVIQDKNVVDLNKMAMQSVSVPDSNFMITGISCVKSNCVAFTTEGSKKIGDLLRSGEKVTKITSRGIETNTRKISF